MQVSAAVFSYPDLAPVDEGKFYLPVSLHSHPLHHHAPVLWRKLRDGIYGFPRSYNFFSISL